MLPFVCLDIESVVLAFSQFIHRLMMQGLQHMRLGTQNLVRKGEGDRHRRQKTVHGKQASIQAPGAATRLTSCAAPHPLMLRRLVVRSFRLLLVSSSSSSFLLAYLWMVFACVMRFCFSSCSSANKQQQKIR